MTLTETKPEVTKTTVRKIHIVESDGQGGYLDKCLCGYLWDRVNVQYKGDICQECVEELKRRQS